MALPGAISSGAGVGGQLGPVDEARRAARSQARRPSPPAGPARRPRARLAQPRGWGGHDRHRAAVAQDVGVVVTVLGIGRHRDGRAMGAVSAIGFQAVLGTITTGRRPLRRRRAGGARRAAWRANSHVMLCWPAGMGRNIGLSGHSGPGKHHRRRLGQLG